MGEWNKYKIGDVCDISSSKRIFAEEYCNKGIPFYRGKEIIEKHNGNEPSTELFISQDRYTEIVSKHGAPIPGDLLLTSVGTLGVPYIVKNETFYFKDGNLTWFQNFRGINSMYLYYWFHSIHAKQQIDGKCIGSTQKALTIDTLRNFEISLPSIETQNRIVGVLKSIDDKIELNNRINHNLEEQAQAVFDSFFDNPIKEKTLRLDSIAEINPKRTLAKGANVRCIDMSYLSTSGSFPSGWEYRQYSGGMKFINGDTLMARITPCLENGKVAYVNFLEEDEVAFGSTEYIVFHGKNGFPDEMFYFLTRNQNFIDYATKNMNGSSGRQRVSGETIGQYLIPELSEGELEKIRICSKAAMTEILRNSLETINLRVMRDSLLPRLMSGEITC